MSKQSSGARRSSGPVAILLFWSAVSAIGWAQAARPTNAPSADTQGMLDRYCVTCHNAKLKTAGLVLDPQGLSHTGDAAETWEKVLRQLRSGTMPPPGAPRPDATAYANAETFLTRELSASAQARPNPGIVGPVHRLTRTEYKNAIRDFLSIGELPKELDYSTLLPADNVASGFDNLADTLFVSPATMESYLQAARKLSRLAVGDTSMGQLVNIHTMPLRQPQRERAEALPLGTRGGVQIKSYFPLDGEYEFQVQTAVLQREMDEFEITVDGERKAQAQVSRVLRGEEDNPARKTFRIAVGAGPRTIGIAFVERSQALSEAVLRPPGRNRGDLPAVESVTITGPFKPTGPGDTPSRRRLLVCSPKTSAEESDCARKILSATMRRAYRREITEQDLQPVLKFYQTGRTQKDFDRGIQMALERMLVSPNFLFRTEPEPTGAKPGALYRIGETELASRLSFFLWSSIPDDELLNLAAKGTLHQPEVLRAQAKRMLADPRAETLVTNFAAQWLYLRDVEGKDPDLYLFRDFDDGLRASFVRETELFLDSVLRSDRSVLDLITANYTFVNERLAKHYQIPNVTGSQFRKVTFPADSQRGGLLGQGSVLLLTSYATRTSPVLRGKYVLENLLNSPPPPPPPVVPALKTENAGKALSMREAMIQHRANPACASCHAKMDPIGFAMEVFDGVGKWRADDGGNPIDVRSTLPDGTVVDGMNGVRGLVLKTPSLFVEGMVSKLLMYAVGRNVQYFDQPAIRDIARASEGQGYTFASQVYGVIESAPFQYRLAHATDKK